MGLGLNRFYYLHTAYSKIDDSIIGGLVELALRFSYYYDIGKNPLKLGIIVTYIHDEMLGDKTVEVLKSQSNYDIVKSYEITSKEIYPLIQHSVVCLNVRMKEELHKLQIPFQEAKCPLFDDMKNELEDLVNTLNS